MSSSKAFGSRPQRRLASDYHDYGEPDVEHLRLLIELRRLDVPLEHAGKIASWCHSGHCTDTTAELPGSSPSGGPTWRIGSLDSRLWMLALAGSSGISPGRDGSSSWLTRALAARLRTPLSVPLMEGAPAARRPWPGRPGRPLARFSMRRLCGTDRTCDQPITSVRSDTATRPHPPGRPAQLGGERALCKGGFTRNSQPSAELGTNRWLVGETGAGPTPVASSNRATRGVDRVSDREVSLNEAAPIGGRCRRPDRAAGRTRSRIHADTPALGGPHRLPLQVRPRSSPARWLKPPAGKCQGWLPHPVADRRTTTRRSCLRDASRSGIPCRVAQCQS
jgi:DNA-binding transcriptional MerR regulator